jgi:iturin family lipopeptide synthetase B
VEQRIVSSRIENVLDLAPQQEGIVFHSLTDSDTSPYVIQQIFRVDPLGDLANEVEAIGAAVAALARRHAVLRTSIVTSGVARPRQVVLTDREPEFAVVDLRTHSHTDAELRLDRLLADDVARGFRLDLDPLLRVTAVLTGRGGVDRLRLVWTYHHVVMDGWSLARLFADFREYSDLARTGSRDEVLARADRDAVGAKQYADYVGWSASRDRPAFDRYWSDLMRGVEPPARLASVEREPERAAADADETGADAVDGAPADRARYAVTTAAGLPGVLATRYAGRGITLAHMVEAALAVVLARATGTTDVVFGKVVSGRDVDVDGLDDVVGLFVNTVPVRVAVDPRGTVDHLLDAVRAQALATAAHSHGSLARIQSLAEHRDLFECLLAVENFALADQDLVDAGLRFESAREETNYPLTVTVQPVDDALRFVVMVDPARLAVADARTVVDRLVRVLQAFAGQDDALVGAVDSVGGEERATVDGFATTSYSTLGVSSIGAAFTVAATRNADRTAVVDRGVPLSYAELAAMADRMRSALATAGVGPGDRVGVLGAPTAPLLAGMLGISLAGAAFVPLDPTAPPERLGAIAVDAGTRVVVCADASAARLVDAWVQDSRDPVLVIDASALADADRRVTGETANPGTGPGAPTPDSAASVMYTSGTTGRPKGVVVPHRAVLRLVLDNEALPLHASDTLLLTGSLAFDASTFEVYGMLLNGGKLVLDDRDAVVDPASLGALVDQHHVTVMWLTVSLFNHVVTTDPWALDGVERLVIGGEAVAAEHVHRLHRENPVIQVFNGYGPTENTTFTTVHPFQRGFTRVVIGKPIRNTRVRIVRDGDRACGIGEVGEVVAGGDGVADGYLGSPELTAQSFVRTADGLEYRTGDRGRWLADGTVEYLGRIGDDRQVKVRGYRVELAEVEAALLGFDGVHDVVVAARRDDSGATRLHAYFVADIDAVDLRERATRILPSYMVPARAFRTPSIPLTANGKRDVAALRALDAEHSSVAPDDAAPRTRAEQAVADAFAAVLSLAGVGRNDSFFELGGDSITAIRAVSLLRKAGYHCSVSRVMQSMTVDEIARQIEVAAPAAAPVRHMHGPVGRLPMVDEFLAWGLAQPAHFNQDAVVDLGRVSTTHVRMALDAVWAHHDALRAVLDGQQLTVRRPEDTQYVFAEVHVAVDGEVDGAVADLARQLQPGFDLGTGPLLAAGLVQAPSGATLLLCAHHLVVDVVSWHVVIEDLVNAVRAARAHREVTLPPPTASLQEWSEAIVSAVRAQPASDRTVWSDVERALATEQRPKNPPVDRLPTAPAEPAPIALDAEQTARLKRVAVAYGATIEDLLLAAIGAAVAAVDRRSSIVVQREAHGRPEHPLLPDVSRTVGWFTSIHPVLVECDAASPHRSIVLAKEAVRRVPLGGVGYRVDDDQERRARPSISVNYIGDQGAAARGAGSGAYRLHAAGTASAPGNRVPVGVQVDAFVADGRLRVLTSVGPDADPTVVTAVGQLGTRLATLASTGRRGSARVRTPSDFVRASDMHLAEQEALERTYGNVEDVIDLSPLQHGMLLHHLREPRSRASVVQQAFELGEPLHPGAATPGGGSGADLSARVGAAVAELAARHPVLRTRFAADGLRRPRQVVLEAGEHSGPSVRSASVDGGDAFDGLLHDEVERGFVLAAEPLMRVTVVTDTSRADDVETLVLTYHHIILDGWSLARILDELVALLRGEELQAIGPAERAVFGDVIAASARQPLDASDTYWRNVLDGYDGTPELHTALPFTEPLASASAAARARRSSDAALAARLTARFQATGTTLAHLVQAALALTLGRALDIDDVVIGKVVSGRDGSAAGLENATGLFINTIPARVRWQPAQTVRTLLDDVREQAVASMQHDHVALARVQNLVGHDRLVSCLYTFENYGLDADALDAAGLAFVRGREQTETPLTLTAQRTGDELLLVWLYDAGHFGASDIARFGDRVLDVLEAFCDDDGMSVAQAGVTPDRVLAALPQDTSGEVASRLPDALGAAFVDVAARVPHRVAIADDLESLTYRELWARASAVALDLRRGGVLPGDRVGIAGEASIATTVAIVGVVLVGGSYVPVDVNAPSARARLVLDDADVTAILPVDAAGRRLTDEAGLAVPVIGIEQGRTAPPMVPVERRGDDEAYVMYTSGTTGRPKGVVVPQRAVLRIAWENPDIPITGDDVVLAGSSVAFDAATLELWGSLLHGGRAVIAERATLVDASALAELFARHGVTVMFVTTSLFNSLVGQDPGVLAALRVVMTGGERADAERMRQLYGASGALEMFHVYGPTENTTFTTAYRIPRVLPVGRTVPIGAPIAGGGVVVLDRNGSLCGPGEQGELVATGLGLALGYLGMPDRTAERFPVLDGAVGYRTGDRVQWQADGTLVFLGRVTEHTQVKVRGFRVEIGEIEAAIAQVDGVRDVVVVARSVVGSPTVLAGFVVGAAHVTASTVRDGLRRLLPDYMVPRYIVPLAALPLNVNGKLDADALPWPADEYRGSNEDALPTSAAVSDDVEQRIAAVWSDVLGIRGVAVTDSFFEIGGDSLTIMQVKGQLDATFPGALTIGDLFSCPDLRALSERVRASGKGRLVVERVAVPELDGVEELLGRIVVDVSWDQRHRARAVYAFMLALRLTATRVPQAVLVHEDDGVRSVPFPESADHHANVDQIDRHLVTATPVTRHTPVRIEGDGQVVSVRIGSACAPTAANETVDVTVVLDAGDSRVTLAVEPQGPRADLRPATLIAARYATILEGLLAPTG